MPTQEELDAWFSVTPEERQELAAGRLPERLNKVRGTLGCLSVFAAIFGAGAGLIFAWNTHAWLGPSLGIDRTTFLGAFAAVGAVIAFLLFRRRFGAVQSGAQRVVVKSTVAEVRPEGSVLVALDGRRFRLLHPAPAELQGRFRVLYADVDPNAPPGVTDERRYAAIALEHVD